MVNLYADLVVEGLRTTSVEKSEAEGIKLVPSSLRADVLAELARRGSTAI